MPTDPGRPQTITDVVTQLVQVADDSGDPLDAQLYDSSFVTEVLALLDSILFTHHGSVYWYQHVATEAGAPTRVTSPQLVPVPPANASLGCRVAAGQSVQQGIPGSFTATTFCMVIALAPHNAYNAAGQAASGYVWAWGTGAERLACFYDKANARWQLDSVHSGVTTSLLLADTFVANASKFLLIAGDATHLYLATTGGAISSGARASVPTGLPATFYVGSDGAAANQFDAIYAWTVDADAVLASGDWTYFTALTRPPKAQERITTHMLTMWWGDNTTWDAKYGLASYS